MINTHIRMPDISKPIALDSAERLALRIVETVLVMAGAANEEAAQGAAFVVVAALTQNGVTLVRVADLARKDEILQWQGQAIEDLNTVTKERDALRSPPVPEGWQAFTEPRPCIIHDRSGLALDHSRTLVASLYGTDAPLELTPALRWLLAQEGV